MVQLYCGTVVLVGVVGGGGGSGEGGTGVLSGTPVVAGVLS